MSDRPFSSKIALLFIVVSLLITACSSAQATEEVQGESDEPDEPVVEEQAPEEQPEEATPVIVGMLFVGSVSDQGFSQAAYIGLQSAEENLGIETFIRESVDVPDQVEAFRDLAAQNPDLIIGLGSITQDALVEVASEFPDIQFVVIFGSVTAENVASVSIAQLEASFLAGAQAAMESDTGQVAFLAGIEFPSSVQAGLGFKAGAEYVDPGITVTTAFSGSMVDVAAAKEATLAALDAGADIVYFMYNEATPGTFAAVEEREGAFMINNASRPGECELNPKYIGSAVASLPPTVFAAIDGFVNGTLDRSGTTFIGLKNSSAISFEICSAGDQGNQAAIDEIIEGIISGEIELPGLP